MTYILPLEMADPEERLGFEMAFKGARAAFLPFVSFFTPPEMQAARLATPGSKDVQRVSAADSDASRYFADSSDGLRPGSAEEMLVAGIRFPPSKNDILV